MDDVDVGGSWIALLVAGIINVIYGIGYFIWTLIPLLMGGLYALGAIGSIMNGDMGLDTAIFSLISILTPFLQVAAYFVIGVMGLISIFGAIRLRSASSKGLVMLAAVCAIGAPILGFVFTSLSICNLGSAGMCIIGFLFGNLGTIPAFVAGMIGGAWAIATVRNPEVAAAFEA